MQNHLCIENPAGSPKMKYPELQSRNKTLSQELGGMGGSEEYQGERELKNNNNNSNPLFKSQPWEFKLGFCLPCLGKKTQTSWVENSSQRIRGWQVTWTLMSLTAAQPSSWLSHQFLRKVISYTYVV